MGWSRSISNIFKPLRSFQSSLGDFIDLIGIPFPKERKLPSVCSLTHGVLMSHQKKRGIGLFPAKKRPLRFRKEKKRVGFFVFLRFSSRLLMIVVGVSESFKCCPFLLVDTNVARISGDMTEGCSAGVQFEITGCYFVWPEETFSLRPGKR